MKGLLLFAAALVGMAHGQTCTVTAQYGCFEDTVNPRTLPTQAGSAANSWEECAQLCNQLGQLGTAGMENGNECWCSNSNGAVGNEKDGDCTMTCADDQSQQCGGLSRLNEFAFSCSGGPSYYACSSTGNQCIEDPSGPWTTPDCDNACNTPPPPPGPSPPAPPTPPFPPPPGPPAPSPPPPGPFPPPPGPLPPAPPGTPFFCYSNKTCHTTPDPNNPNQPPMNQTFCSSSCGGGSAGLSTGAVLLVVFFCGGVIPYLIFGSAFMYYRKQARGTDVVPNKEFWTSMPGTIKDGFSFTWGKLTGRGGGGSGAYQQI